VGGEGSMGVYIYIKIYSHKCMFHVGCSMCKRGWEEGGRVQYKMNAFKSAMFM
jgi:hypothetical protein